MSVDGYQLLMELAIRSLGGIIQLGGVALILLGVAGTERVLGRTPFWQRPWKATGTPAWGWIRRIILRRSVVNAPTTTIRGVGAATASASGHAGTVVSEPSWDQLDEAGKIEQLHRDLSRFQEEIRNFTEHLRDRIRRNSEAVRETEESSQRRFDGLDAKVEGIAGQNLKLELVGALLFSIGIGLATWAPELASLF